MTPCAISSKGSPVDVGVADAGAPCGFACGIICCPVAEMAGAPICCGLNSAALAEPESADATASPNFLTIPTALDSLFT
jgi:hypothetical protein